MFFPVTLMYAAILAVIFVGLSVRVIKHRFTTKAILGDGGNANLNVAIRAHGNFTEYVPFALILMAGVEGLGYSSTTVHILGIALVIARVGHVFGLSGKNAAGAGRPVGVIATLLILVVSAVMILVRTI